MRRFLLAAAAATFSFGFATAQEKQTKPVTKPPAEKQDDEKKDLTRKERLAEITKELAAKRSEMVKEINAMKPGEERNKAIQQYQGLGTTTAKKMLDLAKEDPKDPVAMQAALLALQNAVPGKTRRDAGEFLVDNFADDAKILTALPALASGDDKLLGTLAEKTKNKDIRGTALFTMADTEVDNIDYPRTGNALPPDEAAAKLKVAAGKLEKLASDYADVKVANRLGKTIAEATEKKLYFINNLTVGKKAPDFTCELLDDKKAKLSDYKGNVVVLDVWATWCGPCKAMIPHERELVEKMKSKPFKLVSLSADEKKETLTKFLETEEMPWTHMWNGGAKGNFLEQYQIRFYPTIYVLDAKGTIRFKHVRGEKMDRAVETLLKEMSSASE